MCTAEENGSDQIVQCVLSHSAKMAAWSTLSGLVKLMSFLKKEIRILGHHSDSKVELLKFSPSDVLVVSSSSEGCIKVIGNWGNRHQAIESIASLTCIQFSSWHL